MEYLDYIEGKAEAALKVSRQAYDDLHERIHKVVTLLSGGAGAVGALALARWTPGGPLMQWVPLAALAATWALIVGLLLMWGSTSATLSPGLGPSKMLTHYRDWLKSTNGNASRSLLELRLDELRLQNDRHNRYMAECVRRATVLDWGYRGIGVSPLVPTAVVIWLALRC